MPSAPTISEPQAASRPRAPLGATTVRRGFGAVAPLLVSMVATTVMAFGVQVLLARNLSVAEYGALATAMAAVALATPVAGFGIGQYWLRVFGKEGWPARRWLVPSARVLLGTTGASCLLLALGALTLPLDPVSRGLMLAVVPWVPANSLGLLVHARLQLEDRFRSLAIWQAVPSATRLVVAGSAASLGLGLGFVAFGYLTAALVLCVVASTLLYRVADRLRLVGHGALPTAGRTDSVSWRVVPAGSSPFALSTIFHLVYYQSALLMLGSIAGPEAVADYNVGFAMLFGLYILPSVTFQKYLLPRIHRWYETRNARFLDVLRIGSATMLVLGVLICGGLAYVLPTIIPALFGSRYESAIPLATLLLFAVPFRYVSLCFGALLSTGDFVKTKVVCQGVTVALNVVLNVILIRGHGATGAAIATVTSEAVLAVFFLSSLLTFVRRVSWDSSPQFPIRENHNAAQ